MKMDWLRADSRAIPRFIRLGYNSFNCATHLNKDTFETNLSVPKISRCHENTLIKDFKMNPQYVGVQNPFVEQVWIRDLG